jgi:BRCT domain type II-containing protein
MSKMDALRAMREARYEEAAKAAKKPATAKASKPTTKPAKAPVERSAPPAADEAGLCGHRAISGRTCTREAGHAAKSHRYA